MNTLGETTDAGKNINDASTSMENINDVNVPETASSVHGDTESRVHAAAVPSTQDTESVSPCHIDVCIEHRNAELDDHQACMAGSRGGLVNTPASFFTDLSEYRIGRSQHVPSGSKESMYQRALTLMSQRCTSAADMGKEQQMPLIQVDDPPINIQGPSVFFVKQKRPVPMPPLKVWRGYHGNVYFEPIKVAAAPTQLPPPSQQPQPDNCSEPLRKILSTRDHSRSSCSNVTDRTSTLNAHHRVSEGRMRSALSESIPFKKHIYGNNSSTMKRTSKSAPSSYLRKMAILDKRAVFHKYNNYIHEDVEWILGQESTGSLCVMPPKRGDCDPRLKWDRDRICKGSVARKVFANKNGSNPLFSVNGKRKTYKYKVNESYQQISGRDQSGEQLPALGGDETQKSKTDFQCVIPTLEKMNLDDTQSHVKS